MLCPFRPDCDKDQLAKCHSRLHPPQPGKGSPPRSILHNRTADSSKAGSPSPHGSLLKGWAITAEGGGAQDHGA